MPNKNLLNMERLGICGNFDLHLPVTLAYKSSIALYGRRDAVVPAVICWFPYFRKWEVSLGFE